MSLPWQPLLARLALRLRSSTLTACPPTRQASPVLGLTRPLSTVPPPRLAPSPTSPLSPPRPSILLLLRTPFSRTAPCPSSVPPAARKLSTSSSRGAYYPPNRGTYGRGQGQAGYGRQGGSGLAGWKRRFEGLPGEWIVWGIIGQCCGLRGVDQGSEGVRSMVAWARGVGREGCGAFADSCLRAYTPVTDLQLPTLSSTGHGCTASSCTIVSGTHPGSSSSRTTSQPHGPTLSRAGCKQPSNPGDLLATYKIARTADSAWLASGWLRSWCALTCCFSQSGTSHMQVSAAGPSHPRFQLRPLSSLCYAA